MIRITLSALLIGCTFLCGGCSFFAPKTQMFTVVVEPESAQIMLDGRPVLSGRAQDVSRGKDLTIIATASGFYPENRRVGRTLSKAGIVDGVIGCVLLFPLLGLISDGAWELEKDNLYIEMQKK